MEVYVGGKRVSLDPSTMVGKGGEAEVFPFGQGQVIKVFKAPSHPDFHGFKQEQQAAQDRLEEHQRKLPSFPAGLPSAVVGPEQLATGRRAQRVLGYVMRRVENAEPLLRLSDPGYRRGFGSNQVVTAFRNLHAAVASLHQRGVVIGDFNDLNVLVQGDSVHLIDADSYQFGPYLSRVFTDRFLDPLLMAPQAPLLHRPYQASADWYAFTALLMQSLLLVGPWGGVHRPPKSAPRILATQRALRRLSVFSPEVQYPRPARPLSSLPDDLLQLFQRTFEQDHRAPFPGTVLEQLHFCRCPSCGLEHAKRHCPCCQPNAQPPAKVVVAVRGSVVARTLYATEGIILFATVRGGVLHCLSQQGTDLTAQDGAVILRGAPSGELQFVRSARAWWEVHAGSARVVPGSAGGVPPMAPSSSQRGPSNHCYNNNISGSAAAGAPSGPPKYCCYNNNSPEALPGSGVAANDQHLFWVTGDGLFRQGAVGPERVGSVLEGQTRFAVGPRFGAGFYRAGNFTTLFTFEAQRGGLREDTASLRLGGTLLQARFALSDTHAWLLTTTIERGQLRHSALVVDAQGTVLGRTDPADAPEWLAQLQADPVAVGPLLFVPSDRGVLRVELRGGAPTATREFPDTEPFVDAATPLLFDGRGLIAVGTQQVLQLQLQ